MKKYILLFFVLVISSQLYAQTWKWAQQGVGGSEAIGNGAKAVAVDKFGNVYEVGSFMDTISFGSFNLFASNSVTNFFLVKYDSNGNVKWARQCTGVQTTFANGVAIDPAGFIYVGGSANNNFTIGTYTYAGGSFLAKYDTSGNVIWVRDGGGQCNGVASNAIGNIYIAGDFDASAVFGSDTLKSSYFSSYLVKYDTSGSVVWAQQATSSNDYSYAYGVSTDGSDDVEITGYFRTKVSFGGTTLNSTNEDAFIVKYDSNGKVLWAKQSVNGSAQANAITSDNKDNVYVTGIFANGNAKFDTVNVIGNGASCLFLTKYDKYGNVQWAKTDKHANGFGWIGESVLTDGVNELFLAISSGYTDTSNFIFEMGPETLSANVCESVGIILKFDSTGNPVCGSIIPGGGNYASMGLFNNNGNNVYYGSSLMDHRTVFGSDTIGPPFHGPYVYIWPYLAFWQTCITPALGINELHNNNDMALFPNPNNGTFTIQVSGITSKSEIEVYNMVGEKVYEMPMPQTPKGALSSVDISNQPAGIYMYRVISESGDLIGSGKFVIEK